MPTEAEWEKAARGKRPVKYPWGNTPPHSNNLNYNNEIKKTTEVGSFENGKSDYGVYDLSGNVYEWVSDWHFPEYYLFSPKKNPKGPKKGQYKVIQKKYREYTNKKWRKTDTIYRKKRELVDMVNIVPIIIPKKRKYKINKKII